MEKELNLVEILKNYPRGTKLYSTIHGEVEFEEVIINDHYPVKYKFIDRDGIYGIDRTTIDGRHFLPSNGECTLFPSKDQRDWSKFSIEPELIDGEIYYAKTESVEWIYMYKRTYTFKTSHYAAFLNNYLMAFDGICTDHNEDIKILRKATEEEKRLFFEVIKKHDRKWDTNKKEFVRIKPKFDISTLQPFDKVLGRDRNDQKWKCDFYDNHEKGVNFQFKTINNCYRQCVPYNEETKHLRGSIKMPPEKYIIWEE